MVEQSSEDMISELEALLTKFAGSAVMEAKFLAWTVMFLLKQQKRRTSGVQC